MPVISATNNRLSQGPILPGFQDSDALGTLEIHENLISLKIMKSAHVAVKLHAVLQKLYCFGGKERF